MLRLQNEAGSGLGSIEGVAGLELLDEAELRATVGGAWFLPALYVAGAIGGVLIFGIVVGAGIYILTH
jgi:hypothetical protein